MRRVEEVLKHYWCVLRRPRTREMCPSHALLEGVGGKETLATILYQCKRCKLPIDRVCAALQRESRMLASNGAPRLCGTTSPSSLSYVAFLLSDVDYENYKTPVASSPPADARKDATCMMHACMGESA